MKIHILKLATFPPMTLTFENDVDGVKTHQRAK